MAKLLYRWDNKKFEEEYLKKLEKNWRRWKNNREEYEEKIGKELEGDKLDEKDMQGIWGEDTEVSPEEKSQIGGNIRSENKRLQFYFILFFFFLFKLFYIFYF